MVIAEINNKETLIAGRINIETLIGKKQKDSITLGIRINNGETIIAGTNNK